MPFIPQPMILGEQSTAHFSCTASLALGYEKRAPVLTNIRRFRRCHRPFGTTQHLASYPVLNQAFVDMSHKPR